MAQQDKRREAYGKVVARAWRDPAFKAKLMADPQGILKDAGITVPAGATVTVLENTATHFHLVLPPKPTDALSDDALDRVAGGVMHCGGASCTDENP
jgi:Nitrile hydratase, alpha chain